MQLITLPQMHRKGGEEEEEDARVAAATEQEQSLAPAPAPRGDSSRLRVRELLTTTHGISGRDCGGGEERERERCSSSLSREAIQWD